MREKELEKRKQTSLEIEKGVADRVERLSSISRVLFSTNVAALEKLKEFSVAKNELIYRKNELKAELEEADDGLVALRVEKAVLEAKLAVTKTAPLFPTFLSCSSNNLPIISHILL